MAELLLDHLVMKQGNLESEISSVGLQITMPAVNTKLLLQNSAWIFILIYLIFQVNNQLAHMD